jgi:hypothetical protein
MVEFALATHVCAAIYGHDVTLDEKTHPLLRGVEEWCFFVPGPNGDRLVKTGAEFLDLIRRSGVEDAWYGPETATFEKHWGMVTIWRGERYIWTRSTSKVSEGNETWSQSRFRSQRSTDTVIPPTVTIAEATNRFLDAIERCLAFGREFRARETQFLDAFVATREYLGSQGPPSEWIRRQFPSVGYPVEVMRLQTAAYDAPGAAGPDTWGDWRSADAEIQARFSYCIGEYIHARGDVLTATSRACERAP